MSYTQGPRSHWRATHFTAGLVTIAASPHLNLDLRVQLVAPSLLLIALRYMHTNTPRESQRVGREREGDGDQRKRQVKREMGCLQTYV